MLRVKTQESDDAYIVSLEGRLKAEGAEQVRTLITSDLPEKKLIVNVTDVMFVDSTGEEVLALFKRFGAEFVADNVYTLDICERLNLPLVSNGNRERASKGNVHL